MTLITPPALGILQGQDGYANQDDGSQQPSRWVFLHQFRAVHQSGKVGQTERAT